MQISFKLKLIIMIAIVYIIVLSNIKYIPKPIRNNKSVIILNIVKIFQGFALLSLIKLLLVDLPNFNFERF